MLIYKILTARMLTYPLPRKIKKSLEFVTTDIVIYEYPGRSKITSKEPLLIIDLIK
jgi:hypothetical protein